MITGDVVNVMLFSLLLKWDIRMIEPKKIKKEQAAKLVQLVYQHAKAEIIARYGRIGNLEYADATSDMQEKEDAIRTLVFGTSDLIALGEHWGLIKKGPLKNSSFQIRSNLVVDNGKVRKKTRDEVELEDKKYRRAKQKNKKSKPKKKKTKKKLLNM